MPIESTTPRSRRAILAAALGAGAATVASALGRPLAVRATDGNPVVVGGSYTATRVTKIDALDAGGIGTNAFWGSSHDGIGVVGTSTTGNGVQGSGGSGGVFGTSTNADGVYGGSNTANGVYGTSASGDGVHGDSSSATGVSGKSTSGDGIGGLSTSGIGVHGTSDSGYGVFGESSSDIAVFGQGGAAALPAILGESGGSSTGVQGFSGAFGASPVPPAKTGVYGYAAQDATSRGVTGQTTAGYGVSGIATTGHGVNGTATTGIGAIGYATTGYGTYGYATTTGIGARGYSVSGTGGYFSTSGAKIGTALRAIGKVKFDNCAGVATIAAGTNSVVVTPGIDLTSTSAVVATLMGSAGGLTTVHRVVVNATTDAFTIYLTANATAAVKVAWHVFG